MKKEHAFEIIGLIFVIAVMLFGDNIYQQITGYSIFVSRQGQNNNATEVSATITTVTHTPAPTILFEENFEDGKAQQFSRNGSWRVVEENSENIVYAIDNTKGTDYPSLNFGDSDWTNYSAEYRVKLIDRGGSAPAIILIVRNYYIQSFLPPWDEVVIAVEEPDGGWKRIVTNNMTLTEEEWYLVRVDVFGESIKVYVDEVLVASATDPRKDSGSLSLAVGPDVHAQFDDIRVIKLHK